MVKNMGRGWALANPKPKPKPKPNPKPKPKRLSEEHGQQLRVGEGVAAEEREHAISVLGDRLRRCAELVGFRVRLRAWAGVRVKVRVQVS